jgi:hypothetical protein
VKKRKVNYPKPRTANAPIRGAGMHGEPGRGRATVATVNLAALAGRSDLAIGDRVRIGGDGLYAGEVATVGSLVGGLIPAATVRTDAGRTRRVRAIDLERIVLESSNPETSEQTE